VVPVMMQGDNVRPVFKQLEKPQGPELKRRPLESEALHHRSSLILPPQSELARWLE
jgi:hypothetical protein